jgi:competence protein ComEA
VSGPRALLHVWGLLVLGLLVRAFAAGVLHDQEPRAFGVVSHRVDVNRAGVAELSVLPGIGRSKAEAIVVDRIRHGWFRELADLLRVDGLGPALVQACGDMVTFAVPEEAAAR